KTWKECKAQVSKFPNAKYKKFYNINKAQNFIKGKNDIVKNDINSLQVWTDGSAFKNGTTNARAGIGVFWKDDDTQNLSECVPGDQTNNRAKIFAIIRAIEICNDKVKLLNIMTDNTVKFIHVRDHMGNYGNKQADRLAKE
ncbi:13783_t:CDS:2, partial [Gigaspora margarita]